MYGGDSNGPGALNGRDPTGPTTGIEIETAGRRRPPGRPLSFPEQMRVRLSVNAGRLWYAMIGHMRANCCFISSVVVLRPVPTGGRPARA